jgi:hypothetical protein
MSFSLQCRYSLLHLSVILALLGLLLPPGAWAIRAPDELQAPLPDYDIRKGYSSFMGLQDPRHAEEAKLLREQRLTRRLHIPVGRASLPQRLREEAESVLSRLLGHDVSVEWHANETPRQLFRENGVLAQPQPGANMEDSARHFLRTNREVFLLADDEIDGLAKLRATRGPTGSQHVRFRQTLGGIPVFNADLKVSMDNNNAVLSVAGTVFPGLTTSLTPPLSVVEAVQAAVGYVGPLVQEGEQDAVDRAVPPSNFPKVITTESGRRIEITKVDRRGAFEPVVLTSEPGPEHKTTLRLGHWLHEVSASLVVFPLTPAEGRLAWQVYFLKSSREWYALVVDAEDGTLLHRTNLVQFDRPQGRVFRTHPDAGDQVLRSFVGNAKASPETFVDVTQSSTRGNNVIMGIGASDTSGPHHFEFPFRNDFQKHGLTHFNLNGTTLRFTPNASGGYDLRLPAFDDPPHGTDLELKNNDSVRVDVSTAFEFFGRSVSRFFVNSNGHLTMLTADPFSAEEDPFSLIFGPPRIMGLWDNLNPRAGGTVGLSQTADRVCVRWNDVPQFRVKDTNSFAICIDISNGVIELSYANVSARDGMVGISPGLLATVATTAVNTFSAPASTIGPVGFVRHFPTHADAAAAATNIFWHLNANGHDRLYARGFTEEAGNFQVDNFNRGGRERDPIIVIPSHFPLDRNSASFATPPDGVCCPFTVFGLFFPDPPDLSVRADSAFDSDVILHEHAHGLTARLLGGEGALSAVQSGAMWEGWSDWYALHYANDEVIAEYSTGNATSGVRTFAYNNANPLRYNDFANRSGPFSDLFGNSIGHGVIFLPEVHADGEIWANVLAHLRRRLSAGRDPLTAVQIEALVTEALHFTPANPSMVEARNAIILANRTIGGQVKVCDIWEAFASRGFGKHATNNELALNALPGDVASVFATFDRPSSCGGGYARGSVIGSTATFETAAVGDTSANRWTGDGLWHVTNRRASTGNRSFYYGREATGNYRTGNNANFGALTSQVLDLSGISHPVLEFDLALSSEASFPFDTLWIRVSTNDGASLPLQRSIVFWPTCEFIIIPFCEDITFRHYRIDLTPPPGVSLANARVQFYFDTLDGAANNFEGVYIDNIAIRNYIEN